MAPETLTEILDRTARRHPTRTALVGRRPGGARWALSWSGFRRRVRGAAAELREAGVGPGEAAVVAAPSGPRRVLAALAVHEVGAQELPLAPDLHERQAEAVVSRADPSVAVVGGGPVDGVLGEAADAVVDAGELPALDTPGTGEVREDGAPEAEPGDGGLLLPTGWGEATELLVVPAPDLAAGVGAAAEALPVGPGDRVLQAAPPTHVPAWTAGTLVPMARGAAVAFPSGEEAAPGRARGRGLLEAVRDLEADVLSVGSEGVADAWRAREAGKAGVDGLATVVVAGTPVPAAREDLSEAGLEVVEVFGRAETGPVVACGPRRDGGLAPVPGVGLEVVDGELHVEGPGVPDGGPAAEAMRATGFRAAVGGEGRVRPRGRVEARFGEGKGAVQAEEVEAAFRAAHPGVARAVAVALEGEVGVGVLPDAEADPVEEDLLEVAAAADRGPDQVAVLEAAPSLARGLADHAGEVHRGRCAEAWEETLAWEPVGR